MNLLAQIKNDALTARKNRDEVASSLLVTLLGEASLAGKNAGNRESTDEEVLKTVQKFMKGVDETLVVRPSDARYLRERELLEHYLPKQLVGEDLDKAIEQAFRHANIAVPSPKDMGLVMKAMNQLYPGAFDGKVVSQKIRDFLAHL